MSPSSALRTPCRWPGAQDLSDVISRTCLRAYVLEALGPWLAAEIPYLIENGVVAHKGRGARSVPFRETSGGA